RPYAQFTTATSAEPIEQLGASGTVEFTCDELALAPGVYQVDAILTRRGAVDAIDRRRRRCRLEVTPGRPVRGVFYAPHRWQLRPADVSAPRRARHSDRVANGFPPTA